MRKPGQLITKAEQKEHGLSRGEARKLESREYWSGELLLNENTKVIQAEQKESKADAKAAKKEAKAVKIEANKAKREGYKGRDVDAVLSDGERHRILSTEVKRLTGAFQPWKIKERNDTSVVLFDPAAEPIGAGGALGILATGGLSLAVTPIRRGRENDRYLSVFVAPCGAIERSGYWAYNGTDYSNVPMLDD